MSDDLKGRLRKLEGGDKYGSTVWYRNPDGPEAASRIEKLEAALREIALDDPDCCMIADRMRETAEIALGLKND